MDKRDSISAERAVLLDINFLKLISSAALANFVQPIFTLFLSLLAVNLGASVFEIGLIGGASYVVYSFMPFVMGRFSDRGQARKFFIILSLALLATVSILYSLSENPIDLIVLRLAEGLGWAAFWPSIDSAVSHDTQVDPKRALAVFNLSWSFAAALGPLVGSFVVVIFSIRQVFIFNAVFLLLAFSLNLIPYSKFRRSRKIGNSISGEKETAIRETRISESVESAIVESNMPDNPNGTGLKKVSPLFYVVSLALCALTFSTIASFFSPYARSQGLTIVVIGAISLTFGAARFFGYLLTSNVWVSNFLLDRKIRSRNIFALLFLLVLSSLLMVLHSTSGLIYFLSFGLVGFAYSLVYYVGMVALLAETSKEKMGAGAGIFETSIGMGSLAGPVIAGAVAGNSLTLPFIVPSFCAIPTLVALFLLWRSGTNQKSMTSGRI
ncbi:MAG: MFS transporter [Thaumarchaeota archaeon]|nr:MFS transporter [Nitrososphaerota archaeon]